MLIMKRKFNRYAALALFGALVLGGCREDHFIEGGEYIPALNSATLAPATNASGTQRAYVGTEVSVEGFNLDRLSSVTVADVPAEITAQTIKELKFRIPALELEQRDLPHEVEIKAFDAREEQFFAYAYYVTMPVTDASVSGYSPAEGTVGTEITLSGRNLGQVTRIRFGGATVEAADFAEVDDEGAFVKFRVPAVETDAADSEVAIAAEWGTETIDVTGETPFLLHVPVFDALAAQPEGTNSALGDELELSGSNLDLVTAVKWGDKVLVIAAQSAEALTVRFPSSIEAETPAVQSRALVAEWGLSEPAQSTALSEAWRVDTTPSSTATVPEFGQMTVEGGKFYLGKTVTVTGANLTTVEKIELQYDAERVEAAVAAGATDSELKFAVPDGVTFDIAREVSVVAVHNGGEQLEIGKATVYPFYYYKDLQIGLGSSSKSTYTAYAREHAFFLPNTGEVISSDSWWENAVDSWAKSGSNKVTTAANKVAAGTTAEQYRAVQPYFFFSAASATASTPNKLAMNSPANSSSQLKTHFYGDSNTALPSTFGTPLLYFRVLYSASADVTMKSQIVDGSVTTLTDYDTMGGSAAPALSTAESTSAWMVGSVIAVQYVNYRHALDGGKPTSAADISRQGFIHIKEVTCADLSTGQALDSREGYITFDFYWSKTLNE